MRNPGTMTAASSLGNEGLVAASAFVKLVKDDKKRIAVLRNDFIIFEANPFLFMSVRTGKRRASEDRFKDL